MTASIPVTIDVIKSQLPQVKAEIAALNADQKRELNTHLRQLGIQRRLQNEATREVRDRIREQRRLNQLSDKLTRDLEKQAREQSRAMAAGRDRFRTGAGAAGAAGGILAAGAIDAIQAADQARVTETAFLNLSGGAAEATKNLEAMGRATRDLANEQEQQQIANLLLGLGIAKTSDDLEKVTTGARRLGAAFKGMGAEEAAEQFSLLITNQSFLRLDQFGLSADKVRQRVEALKNEGIEAEEAFRLAVFEEMENTLSRLGPEVETTTDAFNRLRAHTDDLKVEFGNLLVAGGDAGLLGLLDRLVVNLTDGAKAWQTTIEQLQLVGTALDKTNIIAADSVLTWENLGKAFRFAVNPAQGMVELGRDLSEVIGGGVPKWNDFTDAMVESGQALEEQKRLADEAAQTAKRLADEAAAAAKAEAERTEALEKESKRLGKVADIQEDSLRKMLDIQDKFAEDSADAWRDWRADQEDNFEDYGKRRSEILERSAKDAAKIERDLAKDLAKLSKDTTKDLAKIDRDEQKKINELKEKAAKDERQQSKKRAVDTLADEKLFQFDLRQLAAQGQANAIQEALERRAIEEEIERDKQHNEAQIKDENLRDDVQRIRDEADERRQQERADAQERRAELKADADEERALKEQALMEALDDERQNFVERSEALAEHRRDKLAQLDQDKQESIQKIAEQLTEINDITHTELGKLTPLFAEFGEDAGEAFSEGLAKGFDVNKQLEQLLGRSVGSQRLGRTPGALPTPSRTSSGVGRTRRRSFQDGGFVEGPIGSPQLIIAHGGELVLNRQQQQQMGQSLSVNVNVGSGLERLIPFVQRHVEMAFQEYTDQVLAPALG
jgi:hypothetical protein